MKNLIALAILLAISTARAGSIKMPASPNLNRNAGQDIPISFTASGWPAGQLAQVYLVNTKTWIPERVGPDKPVSNGANRLSLTIPWSWWWEPSRYLVKIVCGNTQATSTGVVSIRSAVIWPYGGTVYPRNRLGTVIWTTANYIVADYLTISLWNEDTRELIELADDVDPYAGQYQFQVPDVAGTHFRILIHGYLLIPEYDEYGEEWLWPDLNDFTSSERISIQ